MSGSTAVGAVRAVGGPFVGLTHFTENESDLFFGREDEIGVILANLRAARMTLLYAQTGVGKSSLLQAGVAAQLRRQAESDRANRGAARFAPVVHSSWSEDPVAGTIAAIEEAIRPLSADDATVQLPRTSLEAAIAEGIRLLDAPLLVILDQFEEYFLYRPRHEEEGAFADQLAACVNRSDLRANFLISIREDSYAAIGDLFRGRIGNIYGNFLHLDYLTRDGARAAIVKPIELWNAEQGTDVAIEPALVDLVVNADGVRLDPPITDENGRPTADRRDTRDSPQLVETTNLQLVMKRLWDEELGRNSNVLRLTTYKRLGGAKAIIGSHLDGAMAALSSRQQDTAASIFNYLVTPDGTKIALTVDTLATWSGLAESEIDPVLRRLSEGDVHVLRSVTAGRADGDRKYEITHDALAQPIVDWRERHRKQQELAAEKARQERLAAQVEQERREKEEAQRQALEAQAREARERKRKRIAVVAFAIVVVGFLATSAAFAVIESNNAKRTTRVNRSIESAARITDLSGSPSFGPSAAAVAGIAAYRGLARTFEARNAALASLQINAGMPKIGVGHSLEVLGVAFAPKSSFVVSGSGDGTVRLWDRSGRQLGHPLIAHQFTLVWGVAVSHNGRAVVAARENGKIDVWDVSDVRHGRRVKTLTVSKKNERTVAFSRDGRLLAAGGDDGRVKLWKWQPTDVAHPRPLGSTGGLGVVNALAFTPNGREVVLATDRGVERLGVHDIMRLRTHAKAERLTADRAVSVAVASDGSVAAGLDTDSPGVRVWSFGSARKKTRFFPTSDVVNSLAFARNGSVLVAGGDDWNVTTWDLTTGREFGPPRLHEGAVNAVAVSPDGRLLASGGDDNLVKIWPVEPVAPLAMKVGSLQADKLSDPSHPPSIYGLGANAHGLVAAAAGDDGAFVWRAHPLHADHPAAPLFAVPTPGGATDDIAYSGSNLIVPSGDSFRLWDTGDSCATMPKRPCARGPGGNRSPKRLIKYIAVNRTGKVLATGDDGGTVELWDISKSDHPVFRANLPTHLKGDVDALRFSPAADVLAVGGDDGTLRLWNVRNPRIPSQLGPTRIPHGGEATTAVAFAPNGRLLVSGGADQQVALWQVDPKSGLNKTPEARTQTNTILSLAFSPDGKTLFAGDGDGSVCVYELATRRSIGSGDCLQGHFSNQNRAAIYAIVTADDGKTLLTAGEGTPVVAWTSLLWSEKRADDGKLTEAACRLAGRNLTEAEWNNAFAGTELASHRSATCKGYPLP